MFSLGECIYEDGVRDGEERGMEALILDNLEEHVPEERILQKLQNRFHLTQEDAKASFEKYAASLQA